MKDVAQAEWWVVQQRLDDSTWYTVGDGAVGIDDVAMVIKAAQERHPDRPIRTIRTVETVTIEDVPNG